MIHCLTKMSRVKEKNTSQEKCLTNKRQTIMNDTIELEQILIHHAIPIIVVY